MTPELYQKVIVPILATASEKRCHDYQSVINQVRLKTPEDSTDYPIIALFERVTSYYLRHDSPGKAFGPLIRWEDKRSAIPDDLTKEERQFLADLLPTVEDAEMRARIADTLWELKFGKATDYAVEAIKAYIQAAKESDAEGWTFEAEHYGRALKIYATIKRQDKDRSIGVVVTDDIVAAIKESAQTGHPYLTMKLIDLILNSRLPESKDFIPTATSVAEKLEADGNWHGAHDAWLLVGRLQAVAKLHDDATQSAKRAAETYVKLADIAEAGENPSYMLICSWLQSAVEAYRQIKGEKDRTEELYRRLTASQPRIHDEMQHHSFEINIKEPVEKAIEHVSNRNTAIGALMAVAFYRRPTSMQELKEYAENSAKAGPLADMLAGTYHNKSGHVVAKKGINESEESKLHRQASEIRKMQPSLFIGPAMDQVRYEHSVSVQSWFDFMHTHPFVPDSRRMTYAEGLSHGFYGDYVAACHILMPQLENSLRHLLKDAGEETSWITQDGLQQEKTLTQLLDNPKLTEILGEAVVFDLKGLLDEKIGDNFRHLLLHGLKDDDELNGALPVYFYWLVLHLIFLPLNREGLDLGKKKIEAPTETA